MNLSLESRLRFKIQHSLDDDDDDDDGDDDDDDNKFPNYEIKNQLQIDLSRRIFDGFQKN